MDENSDEDFTFMFEALVCENDCLKQELERLKNLQWNQMAYHAGTSKGKLVRLIQNIHSDFNAIARTMASIAGMSYEEICAYKNRGILRFNPHVNKKKKDEPLEYINFIEVYSLCYNMLSMADRKFALERRSIQGTKLDYIMQHPEMTHKFGIILGIMHQLISTCRYTVVNAVNQTIHTYQRKLARQNQI